MSTICDSEGADSDVVAVEIAEGELEGLGVWVQMGFLLKANDEGACSL